MGLKNAKCLIADFSHPGDNYAGGKIVNLKVGKSVNWQQELAGTVRVI